MSCKLVGAAPLGLDVPGAQSQVAIPQVRQALERGEVSGELQVVVVAQRVCASPASRLSSALDRPLVVAGKEPGAKPALADRAPGRVGAGGAQQHADGEAAEIARVAPDIEPELGRGGEMDAFQRVGELAETVSPCAGGRGLLGLKQLPVANGGRIGDRAGQLDLGAGKTGSEMIQRPFVTGQKAKLGLDILDGQLARRLVGFREGPDQAAPRAARANQPGIEAGPGPGD